MSRRISVLVLLLALLFAPAVHAETATTNSAKPKPLKALFAQRKEALQTKLSQMRLTFQQEREDFKANLQNISDERKKLLVEKIDLKLASVNASAAARMNLSLDKMEKLLDKFASRTASLKEQGTDVTSVETAIQAAKDAIQEARDAVATQAEKEYVAEISDETGLRNAMGEAMSALRKDLKTTHDVVKKAKQKVIDVARALAKLNKVSVTPTP